MKEEIENQYNYYFRLVNLFNFIINLFYYFINLFNPII